MTANDTVHEQIRGPVFPIVTPFDEHGDVDHEELREYVDYLVAGGAENLLVTVGTSRFNLLTAPEMRAVNETVATTAPEDVFTIVSGPGPSAGSTRENVSFASHTESIGADALILAYPERWYGEEPITEFFRDVSRSTDVPLLVHAVPLRDGFGGVEDRVYFDADGLEQILAIEGVIGVKEESGQRELYEEILARFNDDAAIIGAGGAMDRYLGDSKLGATTYLVGIGSVLPALACEFYDAVHSGERDRAREITRENEEPYFDAAVTMGWHRALKETLHQLDLMSPYERDPLNRVPEDDRQELGQIIDSCGWTA